VFITFTFHFSLFRSLVLFTRINSLLNLFLVLVSGLLLLLLLRISKYLYLDYVLNYTVRGRDTRYDYTNAFRIRNTGEGDVELAIRKYLRLQ